MRIASRTICFAVLLAAVTHVAAEDFTNAVRALLRDHIELDRRSIGMVVGIVDENGEHVISYGKTDNGDTPEVNGDTVFEIGSITKTFTTLLLEDMIERGEMRLDDPVAKYLPGLARMPTRGGKDITLFHLTTHTSALPSDPDNLSPPRWNNPYAGYTRERLYEFLSGYALPRDPGVKVEYSNIGMGLAAHAIALKAGTNFESLVVDRICNPLKMDSTRIRLTPELRARHTVGHDWFGKAVEDIDFPEPITGAGAIHSSANDMLKYLSANIGLTPSRLSPLMEKTHVVRVENQALAWSCSGDIIGHGGATFGCSAFVGFDKKRRRGVVVLSNSMFDSAGDLGFLLLNSQWQENKRPKTVTLTSQACEAFVGSYRINSDYVIGIRCEADRLFMRGSARLSTELVPDSEGNFFLRVSGTPVTFTRDARGSVTGMISHIYGTAPVTFTRFSSQSPKPAEIPGVPPIANIKPKDFDDCVGQYRLASGRTVTMSHDGDRLIMKSEGHMTHELYPESETHFFCSYLPARLTFIKNGKGDVTSFTAITDLADKEFAGTTWRKIRPSIWDSFVGYRNLVVAVLVGSGLLLLLAYIRSRKNRRVPG
ncbi:MAG: serine hydrolase [Akkermansiaceae bacterium]|nr:serine hydrolase [Verrucomicrobiales bacterium]